MIIDEKVTVYPPPSSLLPAPIRQQHHDQQPKPHHGKRQ